MTLRRRTKTAALLTWILLPVFFALFVQPAQADERILRMDVVAEVQADAVVRVQERLEVRVENIDINRGIIRVFPTDYTGSDGRAYRTNFRLIEAKVDGSRTPAQTERVGQNIEIRLGDPNRTLSRGVHTFELIYAAVGWVAFHSDFDELFWNVTGEAWAWPIDAASFRLILPGGTKPERLSAYTGRYGDRGQDVAAGPEGSLVTTRTLAPGEGFSVACGWPKGLVAQPQEDALERTHDFFYRYRLPLSILFILIVFTYYFSVWYVVGKDPTKGTVIPLWRPPAGIEPGFARYLLKMKYSQEVLVADLLQLAVLGFVHFTNNDRGETMIIPAPKGLEEGGTAGLSESLRALFVALFVGVGRGGVSVTKNNGDVFYRASQRLELEYSERAKRYYSKNTLYSLVGLLLFLPLIAAAFYMAGDWSSVMDLAGPLSFLVMIGINAFSRKKWVFALLLLLLLLFPVGALFSLDWIVLGALAVAAAIAFGFSMIMPARTKKGVQVLAEIEGLAMYMGTAERHRLAMLNPPNETPQLFETLLPYAYALDCAETWANSFESLLKKAAYKPEWDRVSADDVFAWDLFSRGMVNGMARNINSSISSYRSAQVKESPTYRGGSGFGGGGGVGRGGGGGGGRGW